MSGKESLQQGADRLDQVVRDVRERQRELAGATSLKAPAESPADAWQRKFLSEGFGPEAAEGTPAAMRGADAAPSPEQQDHLMRELKSRANAAPATVGAPAPAAMREAPAHEASLRPADMRFEHAAEPETEKKKRGFWSRLFFG